MPLPEASHLEHQSETLVFESDWLASRPFFYNERTGRSGANINEVIDLVNVEIDPEGFNDYLDFGFSVFGRTPVRDVRMLRHSSRLWSGPSGLRVEHLPDPTLEGLEEQSSVADVLELASARINDAAAAGAAGDLVVPTSGGYDSRFINVLLSDKRRVRAFTYGTSDRPEESFEVVKAKELARRLGIRWELVPLGGFHQRIDAWDALYGVSTHAHGMYHLEFYDFIRSRTAAGSVVFTGACGDWFNGYLWPEGETGRLDRPDDVYAVLRWLRGMTADSAMSRFQSERLGAQELLESDPRLRTQYRPRMVTGCRLRIALLSYLVRAPEAIGFNCIAPFTDADVAMAMLKLPEAAR